MFAAADGTLHDVAGGIDVPDDNDDATRGAMPTNAPKPVQQKLV
jgi:hypothetical protein